MIRAYSTVSETVAVCSIEPEVAVTVIVEVTGVGPPPPLLLPPPSPPQAAIPPSPRIAIAIMQTLRTAPRILQLSRNSDDTTIAPGKNGPGLRFKASVSPVMVSVVEAEVPDGVTVEGLKAQEAPLGNPLQAKFTVELKPFWGVTVK